MIALWIIALAQVLQIGFKCYEFGRSLYFARRISHVQATVLSGPIEPSEYEKTVLEFMRAQIDVLKPKKPEWE